VNITIPKGAFPGKHKGAVVVASSTGTGTVNLAKRVAIIYDVEVPGALKAAATPAWAADTTYYNASIRNLSATKNFAGATDRIDELKALGIEGLILEPIFPIGKSKMLGTVGSIFASSDLSTVNTSLGNEASFKKLVDTARTNGIKVILTVPLSSAAVDHSWVIEKPNWFVRDAKFALVANADTPFLASYDFKQLELRQQLIEDISGLVTKFGIDGFVFTDATKVDQGFVDELCYRLQSIKELMIGTTDDKSAKYFVNSISFTRNDALRVLFDKIDDGALKVSDFQKLVKDLNATYIGVEFPLNHVSSYETMVGLKTETARLGAALALGAALTFTLPGAPMIFMGQEVKSIKALKPYDADTIVWPKKNPAEYTAYQQLIKLRKLNAALYTGKASVDAVMLKTSSTSLLAFQRKSGKSTVIMIANLSKKTLKASFDGGSALKTYTFSNDKVFNMKATGNSVNLDPFEYEIYTLAVVK
jgi:glycosidase